MSIIKDIKEEHENRAKWLDENLTTRERMRVEREVALKMCGALIFYLVIMYIFSIFI